MSNEEQFSTNEIAAIAHELYNSLTISILHTEGGKSYPMLVSQAMVDEALRLRAESKSYQEVARIMEVTTSIARNLVMHGLRDTPTESPSEQRQIELRKLDKLEQAALEVLWVAQAGESAASQTRALNAVDKLIKLSESRRKLLGLDAPTLMETRAVELVLNGVDVTSL